jgi:hypothetical protein
MYAKLTFIYVFIVPGAYNTGRSQPYYGTGFYPCFPNRNRKTGKKTGSVVCSQLGSRTFQKNFRILKIQELFLKDEYYNFVNLIEF